MKRLLALLMLLSLIFTLSLPTLASEKQYDYSTTANSGQRDEICTTLAGTSAGEYYTGSYAYESLSQLSQEDLLFALRKLTKDTHRYESSYADCRDRAKDTDCIGGDPSTISLIFTGFTAARAQFIGSGSTGWNREHVWPKAQGGFSNAGAGADLHHIRPADSKVNNQHGNLKYGEVDNGKESKADSYAGNLLGGYYNKQYFEPLDNVKGDIARICLYVYVRYGGELSKCNNIANVFESTDVLLAWCALDPVDTWEMGRNEVVGAIQGNRNVFIDYPELAWLLFGREVPAGVATPSGSSGDQPPVATPPATEPPATEPPATEPPATEPPATEPPATEPTATEPPATEPPATEPPATEPPATEPAATEPAVSKPPVTEPPTAAPSAPSETQAPTVAPDVKPTEPQTPTPAQKQDYMWLVYTVISVGTIASVVVIVIQRKKQS